MQEPDAEPESAPQEARTCPVCGTKFFATAGREFCPSVSCTELLARNLQRPENRVQYLS
jgi:hypothetical protein